MRIDQNSDSRHAILETIKQRGSATISRLAADLGLTGEAIRQQLLQLRNDGWVELSEIEKSRIGRPAATYRLTVAGDHLFPKHYDQLLAAFTGAVLKELGPAAIMRVLERLSDEQVAKLEASTRGLPIEQRVEALKNFYVEGDPYMTVEQRADGFCLIERNCPYYNTAIERPAICSATVNAMSRLAGVRVERGESFQKGDRRCTFHIREKEPVDAQKLAFALEPHTRL